jgi:hypothetical protein
MAEDLLHDARLGHERDDLAPAAAVLADQDVDVEHALHQLRPARGARGVLRAAWLATRLTLELAVGLLFDGRLGDHVLAPRRRRREHAVVREKMHARAWNQRGQALEEGPPFMRIEEGMCVVPSRKG